MKERASSVFARVVAAIRQWIDTIAPSKEALVQQQRLAVQQACCGLLLEVARLDSAHRDRKHDAAALALEEMFHMEPPDAAALIASADANRYTSYYPPVALINRAWAPSQKARLVEQLWRVAIADGNLDVYEEHLVRKLSDLLYVSHTDFILAKHRVQANPVR